LTTPDQITATTIRRRRLAVDRRFERGPFDIIGDVHGCAHELIALLSELGYAVVETADDDNADGTWGFEVAPPAGQKAIFLGNLVDYGPDAPRVLRLVMSMVARNDALCVLGERDARLAQRLRGRSSASLPGQGQTARQLEKSASAFIDAVRAFLRRRPTHYVLDRGRLIVAHAGLPRALHGRQSAAVREEAVFGRSGAAPDAQPVARRAAWTTGYHARPLVVYGHYPTRRPQWFRRTVNIHTGCVFGGRLTALRYPEAELIAVPARQRYATSVDIDEGPLA
jgi:protein phosphatase